MARITLLRLSRLPFICLGSLIAFWLFLPSPSIRYQQDLLQSKFASGQRVETVVTNLRHGHNIAITWQLIADREHDSTTLRIGNYGWRDHNLTQYVLEGEPDAYPVEKEPVETGDWDEFIIPRWFHAADAILISAQLHMGMESHYFRITVPAPKTVEIWLDIWDGARLVKPAEMRKPENRYGLVARFDNIGTLPGSRSRIDQIRVSKVAGQVHSATFPIRRRLIEPVGLLGTILGFLVEYVLLQAFYFAIPTMTLYIFAVWVCSHCAGDKEVFLHRWLCGWGARSRKERLVWGPSGPVYEDEDAFYEDPRGHSQGNKRSLGAVFRDLGVRPRMSRDIEAG